MRLDPRLPSKMTAQIASILDELMGRNRNVAPNEKVREIKWTDSEVCRFYLVVFCPHDLFTNTKMDLGPCGKLHDDELRRAFQDEPEDSYKKRQVVDDFLRFSTRMLTELQARVKKAKERLQLTQNSEGVLPGSASGQHKDTEEKMLLLSQRIAKLVEEAEAAGTEGNVDKAQGLMKLSDQLREEREQLKRSIMPFLKEEYQAHQKAMEVCETCGAFLIVGDAQQRIDDHLGGKLHIGYAKLRDAVNEIEEGRRKAREVREKEAEERRKKRDEEGKEESSRRRRSRSRERRRSRERGGDHRRRSRSRERRRSRDRDHRRRSRDRSRERSSRHRSRSRDRERRRSRDRSRDRRDRDRDREHRRRSRDRE